MLSKIKAFLSFFFIFIIAISSYSQVVNSESTTQNLGPLTNENIDTYLSEYVKFESISGHEKEAGEWIKNICIENGLHIKQMGDTYQVNRFEKR